MLSQLKQVVLVLKSVSVTLLVHGLLIVALLSGLWWPFDYRKKETLPVNIIEVEAISIGKFASIKEAEEKKLKEVERKKAEEKKRKEAERKKVEEKKRKEAERKKVEEKKRQEVERKKTEEKKRQEVERKKAEEKKRKEAERKKAEEKKRKEAERKKAEEKKRKEAERKKAEEKKRKEAERKKAEEKKRQEAERKKAEQAEEKELLEKIEAERAQQTKQQAINAFLRLKGKIRLAVESAWARPPNIHGLKAVIRVTFSPSGKVISAQVVKSSNNVLFDRSAERAVKKASPLPFPINPEYYQYLKKVDLVFNPDGV